MMSQLPECIPQGLENGRVRNILALEPEDFEIEPIASRLAKINRFAGATPWPYSVAAHSVLVSYLVPKHLALAGLLHDVAESFALGDIVHPVKRLLPDARLIEAAIEHQLRGRWSALEHVCEVKPYDQRAYELECFALRGVWPAEAKDRAVHSREYGTVLLTLTEHDWREARDWFLNRYEALT